jgi:hypothetical protein
MENNAKFHNIDKLENMIINILSEGEKEVWQSIEEEPNAFKRIAQRKLYFQALQKIMKGK